MDTDTAEESIEPNNAAVTPRAWIATLEFSDGSRVHLEKDDFVLVVGANNAGKSAALRGIRDRVFSNKASHVIRSLTLGHEGSAEDVKEWVRRSFHSTDELAADPVYQAHGHGIHLSHIRPLWGNETTLKSLARFFTHLLTADERLQTANPAPNIAMTRESPTHPTQYLARDDALEIRLSKQFERAFGFALVVNRAAGSQIPIHVGERPVPVGGEDRLSLSYVQRIEALPELHTQGDGMRSFAGVLLHTSVGNESLLLIDEPEAFLHPPQAKLLGRLLVQDKPLSRQVFVATHSGDILRGVLESNSPNVRVLRLRRVGTVNKVSQLDNAAVAELWNDPLLRYSNILDALFHEMVVVCESDADARFYSAVADALTTGDEEKKHLDLMFTHCGGKDRIAVVVRSLKALDVPVSVAVDFDVLNNERPLRDIWEATGGDWHLIAADFREVKASIEAKKPELSTEEVRGEIEKILHEAAAPVFSSSDKDKIQRVLRRSSPWAAAKSSGKSMVPSGQPTQTFNRLIESLKARGIHVVEIGELESFARSVGNHGPKWVNQVLERDISSDAELEDARRFVRELIVPHVKMGLSLYQEQGEPDLNG